jgi:hypothetical protein
MSDERIGVLAPARARVEPLALRWTAASTRLVALAEVVLVSAYYLFTLWRIGPNVDQPGMAGFTLVSFAAVFVYCVFLSPTFVHGDSLQERGLGTAVNLFVRKDNLREAAIGFGLVTLLGMAMLLLAAWASDPLFLAKVSWRAVALRFLFYLFSAGFQATVFFQFFFLRILEIVPATGPGNRFGRRAFAAVLFGLLFAGYHHPNITLMGLALVAGAGWAFVFSRTPNLFLVAVSHALLGTVAHKVLGLSMRIGPFYRNGEQFFLTRVVPALSFLNDVIYRP